MVNKKTEIRLKITVSETGDGKGLTASVELDGTAHDIMDLAEIAQRLNIVGETGMDQILRGVLNEDPIGEMTTDGPVH